MKRLLYLLFILLLYSCQPAEEQGYKTVLNPKGPDLGYAPASGVTILTIDGLYLKT